MKVLVTGATGLVGTALCAALVHDGHMVCRLVRPATKTAGGSAGAFDVAWNPESGELGGAAVGAEAVVNLGGASIAERWTEARKKVLRASRVDATRALVTALAKMNAKPDVLISASAIGIYGGNRGDEILTEQSVPGTDFLADLSKDWEAEALRAQEFKTRVVLTRFGIILARNGGALPKIMMPFKFGLGGPVSDGKQWMSWIALEDVVEVIRLALNI